MSVDARVTKDLMQTIQDGQNGFAKGAEKLAETATPELAAAFRRFSEQRSGFYTELETMAKSYGDDIEEPGTAAGALHRGWMALKDALSGKDPEGVLDVAEQGEDHAKKVYEDALTKDISGPLRVVVQRQYEGVCQAHDEVRSLRDSAK